MRVAEIPYLVRMQALSAQLQWGRDLRVAEISITAISRARASKPLQWGRDLRVAEIVAKEKVYSRLRVASMGPRLESRGNAMLIAHKIALDPKLQWGRDLRVAEISSAARARASWACFNGAAT